VAFLEGKGWRGHQEDAKQLLRSPQFGRRHVNKPPTALLQSLKGVPPALRQEGPPTLIANLPRARAKPQQIRLGGFIVGHRGHGRANQRFDQLDKGRMINARAEHWQDDDGQVKQPPSLSKPPTARCAKPVHYLPSKWIAAKDSTAPMEERASHIKTPRMPNSHYLTTNNGLATGVSDPGRPSTSGRHQRSPL
jgi:hypothetical protein